MIFTVVQQSTLFMLGANNLSGFVAHKLSGYYESHKGGFHEADTSTTGDSENAKSPDDRCDHHHHFNWRTAKPLGPAQVPGCDEPTSRCQPAPWM